MDPVDVSQITCGIKTFERPESIQRLLTSIYRMYPTIRCVVVDDSREPSLDPAAWPHVNYIRLPFDTGLGAGRNAMIDAVETPYCLYLDDDHVFVGPTQLAPMQYILDKGEADLVGGQFRERGDHFRLYHGLLEVRDGTLYYKRDQRWIKSIPYPGANLRFYSVDIVNNFFLARTDLLQQVRWDPDLKINTHTEFFLRARNQMRIVYCPSVHVFHNQDRPTAEYTKYRNRRFRPIGLAKHGVQRCRYQGQWK